jgi:hypothetical protein
LILGRIDLQKYGAPVDGAGNVDYRQMRRLVDIDVVDFIRAQPRAMRNVGTGPIAAGLGNRLDDSMLSPVGPGGDKEKAAHHKSGDQQNT